MVRLHHKDMQVTVSLFGHIAAVSLHRKDRYNSPVIRSCYYTHKLLSFTRSYVWASSAVYPAYAVALFVTYLHPPSAPTRLLSVMARPVAPYRLRPLSRSVYSSMSKVVPSFLCSCVFQRCAYFMHCACTRFRVCLLTVYACRCIVQGWR